LTVGIYRSVTESKFNFFGPVCRMSNMRLIDSCIRSNARPRKEWKML